MQFRQIGLPIVDLNRAIEFYSFLLDSDPIARFEPPGFAFFDLGGVRLFLDPNCSPGGSIYLEVDDVRDAVSRLSLRGVTIHTPPHIVFPDDAGIFGPPGNEWLAFIEDSEGNVVGLMSREAPN